MFRLRVTSQPVLLACLCLVPFAAMGGDAPPDPSTPVPEPVEVPVTAAADAPAEPGPEADSVAAATPRIARAVLLPVEFSVFQNGMSGLEIVPDWTEKARANLGTAAASVLMERASLELVAMPELTPGESQQLREHLALVKTFMAQLDQLDTAREAAWQGRKAGLDRRIGQGLDFLREKSGADFAVFIDGAQAKQSGGRIFSQIALAAMGVISIGGGGTYIRASVLDLDAGVLRWFNERTGRESFGVSGSDVRKADETRVVLRKLFEPYPSIPRLVPRW